MGADRLFSHRCRLPEPQHHVPIGEIPKAAGLVPPRGGAMAVSPISPRMRRMQWIAIALVTAAIALNYVDRSTLAIGNVKIRAEFGISATAIGALQSAWSITYALCQVPIGFFLDRLGPRYLVGIALVLWALAQAGGGFGGWAGAFLVGGGGW